MKLVPASQAFATFLNLGRGHVSSGGRPQEICLWTFKRDRKIRATLFADSIELEEDGFKKQTQSFPLSSSGFRHAAKQAIKTEFPRSSRVYLATS